MSSAPGYAGIQKKGRPPRPIASRGGITMSASGGDDRSRDRRRATGQQDRVGRRTSAPRQLITFVDSQDPNSRSTIQRHTAHHSNAQRRDARLASLRNTSRPRILRWTRRQSAEVLPVTSPASSNSSSSISPLPPTQRPRPAGEDNSAPRDTVSEPPSSESRDQSSPERDSAIRYLSEHLCQHTPNRAACEQIIAFAKTDEACTNLLLAYCISLRQHNGDGPDTEADVSAVRTYLNRGTTLLIARLNNPAMSDANIQAVLLLIAYTADYGSFDQVGVHADGLRTLIDERGGIAGDSYPPILELQLRTIGTSCFFHLTLDCVEPCDALPRFPHGLPSARNNPPTRDE